MIMRKKAEYLGFWRQVLCHDPAAADGCAPTTLLLLMHAIIVCFWFLAQPFTEKKGLACQVNKAFAQHLRFVLKAKAAVARQRLRVCTGPVSSITFNTATQQHIITAHAP